ncbi:MAG: HD domain-containing protein [Rickettsiaceae bacterium]|jgi:(p)ppGpp synthase/HD superfamily hydrolase|nr:HD domain-containing protein [Rickettsiaceae bacterium]
MSKLYSPDCFYSLRLLDKLKRIDIEKNTGLDFIIIEKAISFAKKYHDGQMRQTGDPFYSHPLEVAYMVSDYLPKTNVIVASILHDVVEDTEVTVSMIVDNFSWRIAEMVDRLTRDRPDGIKLSVATILNSSYQAKDKEVMLIKLFDRLHNIQTLGVKTPEKTKKIVNETLITFITLSMHLGLLEVEQKLLNSCMYYTAKNKEELQKEDPIFSFNNNSPLLSLVS